MANGYTRRPGLAGNTLKRMSRATVRGSKRRNDPDGTYSAGPYFDLGAINTQLLISIDGGAAQTVTFVDRLSSMQAILNAINTVLGASGTAYDLDGVLHIRSNTAGGSSRISLLEGSANGPLGFVLPIEATGGDLTSAPQGRTDNPHGSAFPVAGENLSTDSMVRALGRLSGNMDGLHATLARPNLTPRNLGTLSATTQTLLDPITGSIPATGIKICIIDDSCFLSSDPTPERLAGAFLLIDPTTNQPPASRIIALRRAGVTAFGTRPVKVTHTIAAIRNGRTVVAPASTFIGVSVGDYVEISNPDNVANLVPWDHRGLRWCVEELATEGANDFLTLRPLATGELYPLGETFSEQMVLELNETAEAGKTYGTLTVYAYPFAEDVDVIVSPPLPAGMEVELWGPQDESVFKRPGSETVVELASRALVSTSSPLPDAILTVPTVTEAGGVLSYTEFYVRKDGRRVRIPAGSLTTTGMLTNGTAYAVVLELLSCTVQFKLASTVLDTDLPFFRVTNATGTFTLDKAVRTDALYQASARYDYVVHVGPGFECRDFAEAYIHVRAMSASSNGAWPAGGAVIVLHSTTGASAVISASLSLATSTGAVGRLKIVGATGSEQFRPQVSGVSMFTFAQLEIDNISVEEVSTTNWRWVADVAGNSYVWRKPTTSMGYEIETGRGGSVGMMQLDVQAGLFQQKMYPTLTRPLGLPATYNQMDLDEITHTTNPGSSANIASLRDGFLRLVLAGGAERLITYADVEALLYGGDVTSARHHHDSRYRATVAPPDIVNSVAVLGNSTRLAREDHAHAHGSQLVNGFHHAAATTVIAGFMSASDKQKLDGIGGDSLLVHKAGAEDITGIKTFLTNALPLLTDQPTTDLQAANRGYVRAEAHRAKWPVVVASRYFLNFPTGSQTGNGGNTGPWVGRPSLIGTQGGAVNLANALNVITPVVVPDVPLSVNGGFCRIRFKYRFYIDEAEAGCQVFIDGVLHKPTPRTSYIVGDGGYAVGNLAGWREYLRTGGATPTYADAEAILTASLMNQDGSGNLTTLEQTVEIDAVPGVVHSVAACVWAIAMRGTGTHQVYFDMNVSVYDPAHPSGSIAGGPVIPVGGSSFDTGYSWYSYDQPYTP